MKKNNNRFDRIDEEYKKEISNIISFEIKDPNVTGLISVTKVKVTTDLKYAKVYVSILNACFIYQAVRCLTMFSGIMFGLFPQTTAYFSLEILLLKALNYIYPLLH